MSTFTFVASGLALGLSLAIGSAISLYRERQRQHRCPICGSSKCAVHEKPRGDHGFLAACIVFGGCALAMIIAGYFVAGGGAP